MKKLMIVAGMLVLAGCQSMQNQTLGGGKEDGTHTHFAYDSSVLDGEAQRKLKSQAEWLKSHPDVEVTIEGHADERGTREYNLGLGERRASAVKDYLTTLGVDGGRIDTVSYGKERPAVNGSTESAWAKNRRAVTVVE
jgi:peptidoglycan-associated lipoprotein